MKTYTITPEPVVVELDEHPHGDELQDHIGLVSGRRTVPNVHILGTSRGGSDDFAALEKSGKLVIQIEDWFKEGQKSTKFDALTIKKSKASA